MRAYTYIDDLVDGIVRLMASGLENGVNIGRQEYVSVDELARTVAAAAGKKVKFKHVSGPVGVKARNFRNDRIRSIGWESQFSLRDGIARTYPWVKAQVDAPMNWPGDRLSPPHRLERGPGRGLPEPA
jgi:nucleoside-diphosphate-sugar epimerase